MAGSRARQRDEQSGQMLVGVIVLLALLFFVGTAMALAVSSSLHTLALAQATDFTNYAAESAVAFETALAPATGIPSDVTTPAATGVAAPCPSGTLVSTGRRINGQATAATACYVAAVDLTNLRILAIAPTTLTRRNPVGLTFACPPAAGASMWGVIGWHSPAGQMADIQVAVAEGGCGDLDASCAPLQDMSNQLPSANGLRSEGLLYFQCVVPRSTTTTGGGKFTLSISNNRGTAYVTDFSVREADGGPDCIATMIGQAGHVVDEADWPLPGCTWSAAKPVLWNGVLP